LIPPTQESELPSDYHERYVGYGDTTFNPLKTWTEYLNRLLGASIGLLIFGTFIRSVPLRKRNPGIFRLALLTLMLVGFQGWLGSRVVASELKPTLISAHMIVALVIVSLLIFMTTRARESTTQPLDIRGLPKVWHRVIAIALLMTLLQVSMGTQIREAVDGITHQALVTERSIWREHFPIIFYIHRSFSSIILMTNLWLVYHLMRSLGQGHPLKKPAMTLAFLVIMAILSGVSLDRLGFPAIVQPFHLLLANLIFGCQFFLWLSTRHALKVALKKSPELLLRTRSG
jgi:cytochrome c oxidase assembly protein subunit 15